jgi:hypothetical protein
MQLNPARLPEVLVGSCIYRELDGAELVEVGIYVHTCISELITHFLKKVVGDPDYSKDVYTHTP